MIRLGWTTPWLGRHLYRVLIVSQGSDSRPLRFILRDSDFGDIPPAQLRLLADAIGDRSAYHDRSSKVAPRLREMADRQDANLAQLAAQWNVRPSQRNNPHSPW